MNTVMDTLRFSERLQNSGFAAEQANARALADELVGQLATKEDIKGFELATNSEFERFELEMKTEFESFKLEMKTEFGSFKSVMKTEFERFGLETKKKFEKVEGEIKAIHLRLDDLDTRFNFLFALLGLLVALELIPIVRAFAG